MESALPFIIDYQAVVESFPGVQHLSLTDYLAEELPYLWRDAYCVMTPRKTDIRRIQLGTFEYFFDDCSSLETNGQVRSDAGWESRLVATCGRSAIQGNARDDYRLKGWVGPTEKTFGNEWDKGHFIGHLIGGAVDQWEMNVFVQRRDFNRGWSEEGKKYCKMERYCMDHPGTFCFSRPIYLDASSRPAFLEFGLLNESGQLWVERFENR